MDTEALVKSLRRMSDRILENHSNVNLIMLFGNDDYERTTSFDYVISANWLNELDQDEGMDIMLDYLFENLNQNEREHISRITIIHSLDPFVQNFTSLMRVSGGVMTVVNCQFNNIIVPYALILESSN